MSSGHDTSESEPQNGISMGNNINADSTESELTDELLLSADSEQQPTLSVVMPTLNEEEGIEECIQHIKTAVAELGVPTEIIISDSSTDQTPEIAKNLGAIVVEPDEGGYGYAYRYAFKRSRGEYIAIGDADTTYDFEELPKLLRHLIKQDADIVLGSRLEGEIKPGAMPNLHQYVGNPLLTKFLNAFYDAGVSDAHSGFRVFRSEALEEMDLETNGMEFASEMIMDASVKNLVIEEVPITYHQRQGDATLDSFRDGWRHVRFMLLNAPGYLFSIPGIIMSIIGLTLMVTGFFNSGVQIGSIGERSVRIGTRSMIAGSLLTIVGYQVASKGIFATIASNPIRQPEDRITNWIINRLSLELGATVGIVVLLSGVGYASFLLYRWFTFGYYSLPPLTHDIVAFTAIVIGMQTIFSSFFMSAMAGKKK